MNKLKFWLANSRDIALPQSMLPCLTAAALCAGQEGCIGWLAIPVALGVGAAHLGMNLADDYYDYKHDSRVRSDLSSTSIRARQEKCTYLRSGQATLKDLRNAIVCFLGFAALMGGIAFFVQWLVNGWQAAMGIVLYAGLGLLLGINYSGKPLELGYHGLGELVIGTMFGPLNMLGVQAAMTGRLFSLPMLCMSIGIGCMVTNIVYVHSVMEVNADGELNKMTFARLLKGQGESRTKELVFIGIFAIMPFVMLLTGIGCGWWSAWYLLTLVTLPMSIFLIRSTKQFVYDEPRNDTPRWWMGPMGDWNLYVKAGMDWFLFRWLLARNICTFFCIILSIVHLVLYFYTL